ncbi:hypothetical protein R4Z10_10370 [Niallia sp. XMNu-256]|uniref:hypothetical protein n=1 Tax=Niallia sp. XMNu-256 TaxID=3082444 RepID=UPI0030CB4027
MGIRIICPCDCSGTLSFAETEGLQMTLDATICPTCDAEGSIVTYTQTGASFQSTIVRPSNCITHNGTTLLLVSGEGTLQNNAGSFPATFYLVLFERSGDIQDTFEFSLFYSDNDNLTALRFGRNVDDENLSISECPAE